MAAGGKKFRWRRWFIHHRECLGVLTGREIDGAIEAWLDGFHPGVFKQIDEGGPGIEAGGVEINSERQ